jgi:hypothetical protein
VVVLWVVQMRDSGAEEAAGSVLNSRDNGLEVVGVQKNSKCSKREDSPRALALLVFLLAFCLSAGTESTMAAGSTAGWTDTLTMPTHTHATARTPSGKHAAKVTLNAEPRRAAWKRTPAWPSQ